VKEKVKEKKKNKKKENKKLEKTRTSTYYFFYCKQRTPSLAIRKETNTEH